MNTEIKLSVRQLKIVQDIKDKGCYRVNNSQNPTAIALIKKGICEWNGGYDALILTEKGKTINLK